MGLRFTLSPGPHPATEVENAPCDPALLDSTGLGTVDATVPLEP
jgi:hypothetical protein